MKPKHKISDGLKQSHIDRFYSLINYNGEDECWDWKRNLPPTGVYPVLRINHRNISVNRLSYFLYYGEFDESLLVCHTCDNPKCVNPHHLFLGTTRDNTLDMIKKGRDKICGEKNIKAKITEKDVLRIRELFATGSMTVLDISAKYPINPETIGKIISGRLWKNVGGSIFDYNKMWKLNLNDIINIRHLFSQGYRCVDIAKIYNKVDQSVISRITRNLSWKNV